MIVVCETQQSAEKLYDSGAAADISPESTSKQTIITSNAGELQMRPSKVQPSAQMKQLAGGTGPTISLPAFAPSSTSPPQSQGEDLVILEDGDYQEVDEGGSEMPFGASKFQDLSQAFVHGQQNVPQVNRQRNQSTGKSTTSKMPATDMNSKNPERVTKSSQRTKMTSASSANNTTQKACFPGSSKQPSSLAIQLQARASVFGRASNANNSSSSNYASTPNFSLSNTVNHRQSKLRKTSPGYKGVVYQSNTTTQYGNTKIQRSHQKKPNRDQDQTSKALKAQCPSKTKKPTMPSRQLKKAHREEDPTSVHLSAEKPFTAEKQRVTCIKKKFTESSEPLDEEHSHLEEALLPLQKLQQPCTGGYLDIEEEKEVPSEHPHDTHKMTPTRNGSNVTACKGFSFDHQARCSSGIIKDYQHQIGGGGGPLLDGFLMVDADESAGQHKYHHQSCIDTGAPVKDSGTSQVMLANDGRYQQQIFRQQHPDRNGSLIFHHNMNKSYVSMTDEDHNNATMHQNCRMEPFFEAGMLMKQSEEHSSNSIEENKFAMKMGQFREVNSQMMPCLLQSQKQHQQMIQTSDQPFLMQDQLRSRQRKNGEDPDGTKTMTFALLQQSMASCDLQASFQRNDTRNPQETTSRTQSMMQQRLQRRIPNNGNNNLIQISGNDSRSELVLIESAPYQAISKTRLWREIFYLRSIIDNKNKCQFQMEQQLRDMEAQLELEKKRSQLLKEQLQQQSSFRSRESDAEVMTAAIEERKSIAQPPILQNEQLFRSRQMIQNNTKSSGSPKNSDTGSIESTSMLQLRHQQSPWSNYPNAAVSEENERALKQAPRKGIQQRQWIKGRTVSTKHTNDRQLQERQNDDSSSQAVNCFNPPTKASQLKVRQPTNLFSKDVNPNAASVLIFGDEELERESHHSLPPQGMNMVHATTRIQSKNQQKKASNLASCSRRNEFSSMMDTSSASLLNRVDEANNQITSNESALINKVNEMQTKVASFGCQSTQQQQQRIFVPQQQQVANLVVDGHHVEGNFDSVVQNSNTEDNGLNIAEQEQFLEYDIDEQVSVGMRIMTSAPQRQPGYSNIVAEAQPADSMIVTSSQSGVAQTLSAQVNVTTLSQHNQVDTPPSNVNAILIPCSNQSIHHQNTQLLQQRPCDQPPPRNIQGDLQSHVDAEDISTLEGVASGLVPQQRIPLPNQQQQPMPRQPSQDSLLDPESFQSNTNMHAQQQVNAASGNNRPMLRSNPAARHHQQLNFYVPSVADDAGMDEFDVADERLHLFGEQVNPDIMTYEQLLALQERIGFVHKGMTVQEMDKYPTMKRSEVRKFLRHGESAEDHQVQRYERDAASDRSHQGLKLLGQNQQQLYHSIVTMVDANRGPSLLEAAEEEEKKSCEESLKDKSLQLQNSSEHDEDVLPADLNHIDAIKRDSMSLSQSNGQYQVEENYQSMQNSRTSASLISESYLVRQRNQRVPINSGDLMAPTLFQLGLSGFGAPDSHSSNAAHEEGKEDLEEAAPEEHHPKEEHLQQIGVSVTMPSHHQTMIPTQTLQQQQQQVYTPLMQHSQHMFQQRRRLGQAMRPPIANLNSTEEEIEQLYSQEVSQEDVFDEGEDVLNRRLPIVVNINGSVPNQQRPSRAHRQNQRVDVPDESQVQANATQVIQVVVPAQDVIAEDHNVYEEHREDEFGVQAPKLACMKQSSYQIMRSSQGENHLEEEICSLRQADQPTIVKHHGQARKQYQNGHQVINATATQVAQILPLVPQKQASSNQSLAIQSSCSVQSSSARSTTLGQEVCIICQEIFLAEDVVKVLPCQHYFHVDCVNQWLLVEKKCPMCMTELF